MRCDNGRVRRFVGLACVLGLLLAVASAAAAGQLGGRPTSPVVRLPGQVLVAPVAVVARRPLCRRGYFPVRLGRRFRCVRPRLPRVRSTADLVRALAALDQRPSSWPRLDAKQRAALAAAERVVLARLPHALDRAHRLGTASSAARAAAAGVQTASFDSGWQRDGADLVREHGTVTTRSGAQSGRTEVVVEEFKEPTSSGPVRYHSREVRTSVVLRDCPNAKGQVTGSASFASRRRTEFSSGEVDTYGESIDATVTAPVNGDARVQPYDLKGTIRLDVVWFRSGKPISQDHQRIGFLDLRVPLGGRHGDLIWGEGPFARASDAYAVDFLMRWLYDERVGPRDEVGPRLKRIEAGWRERKQCVRVVASPSALSGLTVGTRRSVIAHAQAVADGRDVTARIDARATGGTVTPARTTTRLGRPAKLTFAMGRGSSATITITATSNRGIGQRVVRVSGPATKLLTGTLTRTLTDPNANETDRAVYHVRFALAGTAGGVATYVLQPGSTWEASDSGNNGVCSWSGSGSGALAAGGHLERTVTTDVWSGGVITQSASYDVHHSCPGQDPAEYTETHYPIAWGVLSEMGLSGLSGSRSEAGPNRVTNVYAWALREG